MIEIFSNLKSIYPRLLMKQAEQKTKWNQAKIKKLWRKLHQSKS